jgi:hypothetical protein
MMTAAGAPLSYRPSLDEDVVWPGYADEQIRQ